MTCQFANGRLKDTVKHIVFKHVHNPGKPRSEGKPEDISRPNGKSESANQKAAEHQIQQKKHVWRRRDLFTPVTWAPGHLGGRVPI